MQNKRLTWEKEKEGRLGGETWVLGRWGGGEGGDGWKQKVRRSEWDRRDGRELLPSPNAQLHSESN